LVAVVVLIIVGGIQLISPHFFAGLFTAFARPFWRAEVGVKSGELLSVETLVDEKEQLVRQIADMQMRMQTVTALESQNEELKALLGRSTDPTATTTSTARRMNEPGTLAAVLRRPPFSGYDYFIIDIGADYGVSTSSLVYIAGNVLVGRVVDVLETTSKVKLFSSSGESFPVLIGSTHIAATASGRGGGQYEAQVSRDTTVAEGDFVLGSSFADRPMGLVSAILIDPTQPFKTVLFAPPVNLYQTRWVTVQHHGQ
jgi:cell shape-determining protein MreC